MLATHYTLPDGDGDDPQIQLDTGAGPSEQLVTPPKYATAMIVSARTGNIYLSLDGNAATATNCIEIVAGAQPVLIPVRIREGEQLRAQGAVAQAKLQIVWLQDT